MKVEGTASAVVLVQGGKGIRMSSTLGVRPEKIGKDWVLTGIWLDTPGERITVTQLRAILAQAEAAGEKMTLDLPDNLGPSDLRGRKGKPAKVERATRNRAVTSIAKSIRKRGGSRPQIIEAIQKTYDVKRATAYRWLSEAEGKRA